MDCNVAPVPHPGKVVVVVLVGVDVLEPAAAPNVAMSSGRIAGFAVSSEVTNDHWCLGAPGTSVSCRINRSSCPPRAATASLHSAVRSGNANGPDAAGGPNGIPDVASRSPPGVAHVRVPS